MPSGFSNIPDKIKDGNLFAFRGSEKGTVRIGGVALNNIEQWQFSESHPMDEEVQNISYETGSVYGFGHLDFYRHCLDVLNNGTDELVSGREARKTVEIIEATYQSAFSSGQVKTCAMPR